MNKIFKAAILGASGYTGAELIRILTTHPCIEINALTAERKAGSSIGGIFPHLAYLNLPSLQKIDALDLTTFDILFAALPHGITQSLARELPDRVKLVDLSADFRLEDENAYSYWYGAEHIAPELQKKVAYGLPEFYRDAIKSAHITANTGCYVATSLLPLLPLLKNKIISPNNIIIDAGSGVTGAGRALKEGILFSEVNEGTQAYGVGHHRHMAELDQELSKAAGVDVKASFTPHLLPQNRGILATIYVKGEAESIHSTLSSFYKEEPFVHILPKGQQTSTRYVRGSNNCVISIAQDRDATRTIITSALDNLMKGASGQAVQSANLMLGIEETAGLELAPLFP